jgi:penicillin amidase
MLSKVSFKFIFPLLALILIVPLLSHQFAGVPALGKLLNPFTGVVQNEASQAEDAALHLSRNNVQIAFDEHHTPHVFATTEDDMHFSQGYITARDRLWQMDFMSRASAGKLSEILGEPYLYYDRTQRRKGVLKAAKETLVFIESNPETKQALDNYTAGVNEYIAQLDKADLPFEFKLMDYQPGDWTNLKSVLIMKYVGAMLTGYEEDVSASYMKLALGAEDFNLLYPDYKLGEGQRDLALVTLMDSLPHDEYIDYSFLAGSPKVAESNYNPRLGSNAWAVSKDKSANGNALLCNDPHLNLTFPSIWYEIQLKSDQRNVFGYSIPGTPGVIIGFNDNISWGVTNGATDVRDWYKLEVKEDYAKYKIGGEWKELEQVYESIEVRGRETFVDTVYYSEHGPIVIDQSFGGAPEVMDYALRWQLHNPSNEFLAVMLLNKADNHKEFKDGIQHFKFPVQNFVYADVKGNIAYHHQGAILSRSSNGMGKFIMDGTRADHVADQFITQNDLPQELNPARGFVYSANNNPWDSATSSYVNGYYSEVRAARIQQLLGPEQNATPELMKEMQLDNTNFLATMAIPVLADLVKTNDANMLDKLKAWDGKYVKESTEATFFEEWWNAIETETWDELTRYPHYVRPPDDVVLLNLMQNSPSSKYFDREATTKAESAQDIVTAAYELTAKKFESESAPAWGVQNLVSVIHLSNLEALSKMDMSMSGHSDALNAISENWGPSMRLVVEMDETPKAWGMYVGGPSGNPASSQYASNLPMWLEGEYYELKRFASFDEAKTEALYFIEAGRIKILKH